MITIAAQDSQSAERAHRAGAFPVLFISGHSQMTLLNKGVDGKRWPVLQKPFSPTVLWTEVTIRLEAARDNTGPRLNPRKLDRVKGPHQPCP